MHEFHDHFISAIHSRNHLSVCLNSFEKGQITRVCIPFDFGPSRRYKDGLDRYHFYDLDSPDGKHNLSIVPNQLISINILNKVFDPQDYITWTPNWFVVRNWGRYS
jgi:hypothetical protein